MAINPETQYPGKIAPSTPEYPYGQARNVTVPGDGTGTPWESSLVNDLFGFQQALLSDASLVPNGNPDKVGGSQYLDALKKIIRTEADATFDTVTEMRDNTENAIFQSGQKVNTGAGTWRITTSVRPVVIANTSPQLYAFPLNGLWIEDFGAAEGADFSDELRDAIAASHGVTVHIPNKRFLYDGAVISDDVVKLKGEVMPVAKAGFTGLKDGTRIEGTLSFTGKNIWLSDLGVDLGTDTAASAGDGIKCTTTLNAGARLHVENIIALGKNPSDAFHALLFESYQKVTGGNIHGINTLFSCVIKCKDVNLSSVYGQNSQSRGLYLKSDTTFGKSWYINIGNVIVDGNGQSGQGLYIQSDGADMENVNIQNVLIRGYAAPVEANVTGSGTAVKSVNMGNVTLIGATSNAMLVNAPSQLLKDFKISKLSIIDCEARAIWSNGNVNHLQVGMCHIDYAAGTLGAVMEDAVRIGVDTLKTTIGSLTITRNGSALDSDLGFINYENNKANNILGPRICKIKGVGVPETGVSLKASGGGNITLDPVDNVMGKNTTMTTETTASATVTAINNERYTGVQFETGTTLTIINNSPGFTLTINHDPGSGNVRNKGSVAIVLGSNDAAMYVMNKDGVWTEIAS